MRKTKKIILGCLCLVIAGIVFYLYRADHFSINNILVSSADTYFFSSDDTDDLALSNKSQKLKDIFNQDFYYLAKGHHAYAFESKDKKYVLKFPRLRKFRRAPFKDSLLFRSKKNLQEKKRRLNFIFHSHRLAYNLLKNQTGLIFLHFNKTSSLHQTVTLYDRVKRKYSLDLDHSCFVLQKRFVLYEKLLPSLVQSGDKKMVEKMIRAYLDVIVERANRCVVNKDRRGWGRNYGIDQDKAYELDLGAYIYDERLKNVEEYNWEVVQCSLDFRKWLENNSPDMLLFFRNELKQHLKSNKK